MGDVAVVGGVFVSTNPPLVPSDVAVTSAVPSGLVTEIFRLAVVDGPIVTPVSLRLARRWAVPAKVSLAFWPGIVVVTVTAAPPGMMGVVGSAETSYSWSVADPIEALCGSTRIVYVPVVGSDFVS